MKTAGRTILVVAIAATIIGIAACVSVYAIAQRQISAAQQSSVRRDNVSDVNPLSAVVQPAAAPAVTGSTVRVAVIGGMVETGFWAALADRYHQQTGVTIQLIAAGPKDHLERSFKNGIGGIDLITMHSSDTIINLVADGYCINPQPWMRNDLVIVGPAEDPAHIAGMTDAAKALGKIADAHASFVVHSSLGAQEVLRNILELNAIHLDESRLKIMFVENQRNVLQIASDMHAYTIVGRIPFRSGKLPNHDLKLMVSGDPALRRPYVLAVSNPSRIAGLHYPEAVTLAKWMQSEATQQWIESFGVGRLDDHPLFFRTAPSHLQFAQ